MVNKRLDQMVTAIADAIVKLVERTNGPVTLARLEREIPGFAVDRSPGWSYGFEDSGEECFVWGGMTEAGSKALHDVMNGQKLAVQFVHGLVYLAEDRLLENDDWLPLVLLPKWAGCLSGPNFLLRASPLLQERFLAEAAEKGLAGCVGVVTPQTDGLTADRFAVA